MKSGELKRRIREFSCEEDGTEAVEFGIVSGVFVIMLFGIVYLGMWLYNLSSLHWAVERGARVATINHNADQAAIANAVNGYLVSVNAPQATVQFVKTFAGTVPIATISATVTKSYTIPMVDTFDINFTASTTVPQGS